MIDVHNRPIASIVSKIKNRNRAPKPALNDSHPKRTRSLAIPFRRMLILGWRMNSTEKPKSLVCAPTAQFVNSLHVLSIRNLFRKQAGFLNLTVGLCLAAVMITVLLGFGIARHVYLDTGGSGKARVQMDAAFVRPADSLEPSDEAKDKNEIIGNENLKIASLESQPQIMLSTGSPHKIALEIVGFPTKVVLSRVPEVRVSADTTIAVRVTITAASDIPQARLEILPPLNVFLTTPLPVESANLKRGIPVSYNFTLRVPAFPADVRYHLGVVLVEELIGGRLTTVGELDLVVGSPPSTGLDGSGIPGYPK